MRKNGAGKGFFLALGCGRVRGAGGIAGKASEALKFRGYRLTLGGTGSYHGCIMPHPAIETLLILQERDLKRASLEAQLKAIPGEVALVEREIASKKADIEKARTEIKELETKKKGIETEIGSAEAQVGKYKTQQLGVKKNDEYQALGHEIETTQARIGELEGQELEVMYATDEARKRFAAAEKVLKESISEHEGRIKMLKGREAEVAEQLKAAKVAVEEARKGVALPAIRVYDRVAPRGLPAVVPIRDGKCGGCHLKVSSEVDSAARGKSENPGLPCCEQCGRVVYLEA